MRSSRANEQLNLDESPLVTFWEVTRACDLACFHCRASAQPRPHPEELTYEEGLDLIDDIADMGTARLVLTGGDPLKRHDLFDLIAYAVQEKGLTTSLSPSSTKLVAYNNMEAAKEAGVGSISIAIDGPPQVHDEFRLTKGSYGWIMEGAEAAADVGLRLQVNSNVCRFTYDHLEELGEIVKELNPVVWSLFFLVPTGRGRGQEENLLSAQEHEKVFEWMYEMKDRVPFVLKTTEAHHYRRFVIQRLLDEQGKVDWSEVVGVYPTGAEGKTRFTGVNDGNGIVFISHTGQVFPSGFLPVAAGNVRKENLGELYRRGRIFTELRNPDVLKGDCGRCEYRTICGGSRARAYAMTGDYLAEEPLCVHQPGSDGFEL